MPQPTGGKVNASNLNVEGLDEVATPVATDILILGRDGVQNEKVLLSAISGAVIPDPLLIQDGTVGAPGLAFASDTDTGIYNPGAPVIDELAIAAGGVQVANFMNTLGVVQVVVPSINNATFPTVAFGDGDTGIFENTDDNLTISIGGTAQYQINTFNFGSTSGSRAAFRNQAPTATVPTVLARLADLDTGIGSRGTDVMDLIAGGQNCISLAENAAAPEIGFYGTTAIPLQTGVAVTAAAIHAALVALGLITA